MIYMLITVIDLPIIIWLYSKILVIFVALNIIYFMRLNRIKDVLEDKGISQMWLSKKLGKSFSTINAYACNRIQPSLDTLVKIGDILSVDIKDLITDKEERSKE